MDKIIYQLVRGKMTRTNVPLTTTPLHYNFVIVCPYGDWSGFRRLADCERQFNELEQYYAENPDRIFHVVERL